MPGIKALQELNKTVLNLGNEIEIREQRGEKVYNVPIGPNVKDMDDAEDFKDGIPESSSEQIINNSSDFDLSQDAASGENNDTPNFDVDLSDISLDDLGDFDNDFDVDDFMNGSSTEQNSTQEDIPELTELDESLENAEPVEEIMENTENTENKATPVEESEILTDDFDSSNEIDLNVDIPDDLKEIPEEIGEMETLSDDFDIDSLTADLGIETPAETTETSADDLNLDDLTGDLDLPSDTTADDLNLDDLTSDLNLETPAESEPTDSSADDLNLDDLADIPVETSTETNSSGDDLDLDSLLGDVSTDDKTETTDDFDIDSLTADLGIDTPTETTEVSADDLNLDDITGDITADTDSSAEDLNLDDLSEEVPAEQADGTTEDLGSTEGLDADLGDLNLDDLSEEVPAEQADGTTEDLGSTEGLDADLGDLNLDDLSEEVPAEQAEGTTEDLGSTEGLDADLGDLNLDDLSEEVPAEQTEGTTDGENLTELESFDLDNPVEDDKSASDLTSELVTDENGENELGISQNELDNLFSDSANDSDALSANVGGPTDDFDTAGLDALGGMDDLPSFGDDGGAAIPDSFFDDKLGDVSPTDQVSDEALKADFEESSSTENGDFDLETNVGDQNDDLFFDLSSWNDSETGIKTTEKDKLDTPDFAAAKKTFSLKRNKRDDREKNTFTDTEYERFTKNLQEYPLNVRLALEDLIVKNELTDDALFNILEKVLRKVSARQLATELEKVLDITIEVPRNYEKRSAEEYEAYKKSFEYTLKNRILPFGILTSVATVVIILLTLFINRLIVVPITANNLYKKGYEQIENQLYPQSEETFNQAMFVKPIKRWFYTYAHGYEEHKQYDRSRMMYKAILQRYNHEKQAGLEWADLEISLYNYDEAERIIKREILDYHINDVDAMLKLGDMYLEWATEFDSSKFKYAKEQYDYILTSYGADNKILAREMRYYIRTDNLREVLAYKDVFLPQKKALGAQDLTELSGYLLDKRYGKLRTSEEDLRGSIENVRELLTKAYNADKTNPVACYNYGRYFVETKNPRGAKVFLEEAVKYFEQQNIRNKRDTYKFIDTYRLLGEQYVYTKDYLKGESAYVKGIDLFEQEQFSSGFETKENIGKLYNDLADLNFFIVGDNEVALKNYCKAIDNLYDNSTVRYRVGYIQYQNENYDEAMGSFIRSHDTNPNDMNLLLALANTLTMKNDNNVAKSYYERLLEMITAEKARNAVIYGRSSAHDADINDLYMKCSNNLGVTVARIAKKKGDSSMNAKAIVYFQESTRAWDSLTRNPETMLRLEGSNLAEQNIKYLVNPNSDFNVEIYTEIPRMLQGERGIE